MRGLLLVGWVGAAAACATGAGLDDVVEPGTVIGSIGARVALETGFAKGTPVTVGVADTQAGLVGVGAVSAGDSALVGGTYWMSCHVTERPYTDPDDRTR